MSGPANSANYRSKAALTAHGSCDVHGTGPDAYNQQVWVQKRVGISIGARSNERPGRAGGAGQASTFHLRFMLV